MLASAYLFFRLVKRRLALHFYAAIFCTFIMRYTTGDENTVAEFKKVYRKGKFNKIDFDILDNLVKYGNAYEYIYVQDGVIKSKLIAPEDSYPVYNFKNELIAFIEFYIADFAEYYTVYYSDKVETWTNAGTGEDEFYLLEAKKNVSGLPICYKNQNEMDAVFGRSDLDDFIGILDNMEDILSKFTDSFYKHHNPIPVAIGQQLKGDGLPNHVVGGGLVLDDGADFKMISNSLDYQSFEAIYKTLKQALLDVSFTPAVSLNNTDVSNLSEVSMKLLFQLADIKAGLNEKFIREGMEQRFAVIAELLGRMGVSFDEEAFDTLDVVFQYSRPTNEKDIIENLKALREIGAISIESVLENSPYTKDVGQEMERLKGSNANRDVQLDNDGGMSEDKVEKVAKIA
ncbi:phage portal protein [Brevibacillus sp. NSP2.1]|uniref:phage portal protein n=1 Tax=Brevibacillus sp. NSP2.1 TaxID=3003229 RepID=UPI00256EBCE1|nr:phage portal protein [Brevibacillus sp. NSP2.1]